MRISENQLPTNILTKCSKMTEEGQKLHGMNGNADRNIKEECHRNNYGQGGRLKFFKDGKFILELERAREGERVSWVSVHRKTFWPPQGTAPSIPPYRQESSTSLSDDNSSIQSSPWQRDHSWKQTSPSRNISKEMTLYFWKPKSKRSALKSRKRRTPYSSVLEPANSAWSERTFVKIKKEHGRRSLLAIVQYLVDKNFRTSTPPRAESVVSPRKRFLREMEKDKFQADDNCQKRSRSKPQTNQVLPCSSPSSTIVGSPITNGVEETKPPTRNCSYSITSLLAEDRIKRSPSNSPSHYSPTPQQQYYSPTPEDRWYSESVDRLRSIELSHADKCAYPPPYPAQPYLGPYMYPFPPVPPYYGTGVYGRGYVVPSVYHNAPVQVPVTHDTPSCSWGVQSNSREGDHRDDAVADMPLNLSKHSG